MTDQTPETTTMPENPQFEIVGNYLAGWTGGHTCGTSQDGYYGQHEPGCGWEPICTLEQLDEVLNLRQIIVEHLDVLATALEDARAYRLGEASGLDDESLDLGDHLALRRYQALTDALGDRLARCTRCGHVHEFACDVPMLSQSEDGPDEHHCGCSAPETAEDVARWASTPASDPWTEQDPDDEPPF